MKMPQMGVCCICGKYGKLSFEHVPPRSAFNKDAVVEYSLSTVDMSNVQDIRSRVKGKTIQGGSGKYTLCDECNNNTGAWYGAEYVRWARIGASILTRMQIDKVTSCVVVLKGVYPLRFLKQVTTCFFCVKGGFPGSTYSQVHPEMVKFILDKNESLLPPKYKFFLTLYGNDLLRRNPLIGQIRTVFDESGELVDFGNPVLFSEISHPPFSILMTEDKASDFPDVTDITFFKNYKFDESADIKLNLQLQKSDFLIGNY